jgi:hypothetical protein
MANEHEASYNERKTYYVSVQAGSIVEDPTVTSYELVVTANEEELNRLQELLEEYSSMDEAQTAVFGMTPYSSASDKQMNAGVDGLLVDIYRLLYELGTDETKHHVATMGLFPEGSLQ